MDGTKERITELEDRITEIFQHEKLGVGSRKE